MYKRFVKEAVWLIKEGFKQTDLQNYGKIG
jgi:hypothetical protein